jgi:iron complex outermembrane receptor protein
VPSRYVQDIKLRFNLDNLLNKDYIGMVIPSLNTPATFLLGAARSYQASLNFNF